MTDKELGEKIQMMMNDFEENHFKNEGSWPRSTNLVFEFADWFEKKEDWELLDELAIEEKDLGRVKRIVKKNVDKWIEANKKTMMIM